MKDLAERMLAATSKPRAGTALLVLEDGTSFRGMACGSAGEVFGEICFNTSLEGYLEVITDPSYAGQIITMTYPQIGNYGVCVEDAQAAHPALQGLVVRDMCHTPSNWRSNMTLPDYLEREGVVGIEGVDIGEVAYPRDAAAGGEVFGLGGAGGEAALEGVGDIESEIALACEGYAVDGFEVGGTEEAFVERFLLDGGSEVGAEGLAVGDAGDVESVGVAGIGVELGDSFVFHFF